jgi:hypothetical protein
MILKTEMPKIFANIPNVYFLSQTETFHPQNVINGKTIVTHFLLNPFEINQPQLQEPYLLLIQKKTLPKFLSLIQNDNNQNRIGVRVFPSRTSPTYTSPKLLIHFVLSPCYPRFRSLLRF